MIDTMNINLKPCPLCKTNVYSHIVRTGSNCGTDIFDLKITCNNPKCGLEKHFPFSKTDPSFIQWINAISDAIDEWNNREEESMDNEGNH